MLVGTYKPFNDPKKIDESQCNFELCFTMIATIASEFNTRNIPVFLIGDFNGDFNRSNRFDLLLSKFIKDHEYIVLEYLDPKNNFTYISEPIRNKTQKSKIDHIILADSSFRFFFLRFRFRIFF